MGSIGAPEVLVILVIALLVLGPERLPEIARQAGKALGELRRMSAGFQAEMRDAMKPPVAQSPPATTSTAPASPAAPGADAPPSGKGAASGNGAASGGGSTFVWSELPAPTEPGDSPSSPS